MEKSKFYGQANSKRVQHQQTSFITNVKGTFLSKKRKYHNRNIKTAKVNSTGRYIVKIRNHLYTKLGRRLKEKSNKNYLHLQ